MLICYCSLFKESGKKDTACQKLNCQDVWKTAKSENRGESSSQSLSSKKYLKIANCLHRKPDVKLLCLNYPDTEIRENKDEQFSASLSVGDGRYMVDLGRYVEYH